MVGAAVLFATTDAPKSVASPAYKLTSTESDLLLWPTGSSLIGNSNSTTPKAFASANASGDFVREFIGNGTADHPNGGLLIGNGYSYSAADGVTGAVSGG